MIGFTRTEENIACLTGNFQCQRNEHAYYTKATDGFGHFLTDHADRGLFRLGWPP